jgi:hypothetical protein
MDNPHLRVDTMDEDGNISPLDVQKIYYINVVFKLVHDGNSQYQQFRIGMTRDGVVEVQKY